MSEHQAVSLATDTQGYSNAPTVVRASVVRQGGRRTNPTDTNTYATDTTATAVKTTPLTEQIDAIDRIEGVLRRQLFCIKTKKRGAKPRFLVLVRKMGLEPIRG